MLNCVTDTLFQYSQQNTKEKVIIQAENTKIMLCL